MNHQALKARIIDARTRPRRRAALSVALFVCVLCASGVICCIHAQSQQPPSTASVQSAESALEKGDFAKAAALLKALLAEHPKDAHMLYDLGYADERVGDDAGAAQSYAAAISADPNFPEPRVALGLLDARTGHNEKAQTELQSVAGMPSAAPELRGRALRALAVMDEHTHPDAARDELLQAIKLTGETPSDTTLSAELAAQAGDSTGAEQAYRRALTANPQDAEAAAALASVLGHSGRTPEAELTLQEALKAHPADPRLLSELAAVYGQEDKANDGIILLEGARSADSALAANDALTMLLARLYALGDKNDEAARLYSRLAAKRPNDPALLDDYGGVLVKLGRSAEAETVFLKAVGMRGAFPRPEDWAEAEGHLAFAASRNHQPQVALQALAARATVLPNSPASLFLQAISHDALHQNNDAVKEYHAFLAVAGGKYPDQEFQARHRLVALEQKK